jgi:outer membrane protein OmpA-like peptidoglycan-associated protein/tetratricopeptide (TPR) repeat protein
MKKNQLSLFAILLLSMGIMAQPLKRAQKNITLFNYNTAIHILTRVVEKPKYHDEAVPLIAECYRMQHDLFNTKAWYGQAVNLPGASPDCYYYYAQALRSTGDYVNAREYFNKYVSNKPGDKQANVFISYCDSVLGPWKNKIPGFEVKTVTNINSLQSDFGPSFYNGELVFASDRNINEDENYYNWTGRGFLDIFSSQPDAPNEFWGDMKLPSSIKNKLNQSFHDGPAAFSCDNQVYFTRSYMDKAKKQDNIRTNLLKIFYAFAKDGKWSELKPFFLNSTDFSVGHPALSADCNILCFVSDMPGGEGGTDLWMCKKEGDNWGIPVNLGPGINTPYNEMFPSVQADGSLLFSSEGLPGYGGLDLFCAKNDKNGKWINPVNLGLPINSSFDDFAMNYAPGAKNGFFSSNRPGGQGSDDIYAFRELDVQPVIPSKSANEQIPVPLTPKPGHLSGLVIDKTTSKPIEDVSVFIFNPNTGKVTILKTGPDGRYNMIVDRPAKYVIKAMKLNYIDDCMLFNLTEALPDVTVNAQRDLELDKLEINKTFIIENIHYDFNKYNIRPDAMPELDKLVKIMNENPINIELSSHTDCRGSENYNDRLSQNRAQSATDYIVSKGISTSRIVARGYGERKLINKCSDGINCTPEEHQANRRTEFKVLGYSAPLNILDPFDPGNFKDGEELDVHLFPAGFFYPCK